MKRPWTNKLILKFFFYHLIVVLPICVLFYFYSGWIIKNFYTRLLSKQLEDKALIVSRLIPVGSEGEVLDDLCRDLERDAGSRITVIALDGRVLGDSRERSATMENHAARPEVAEALANGTGSSRRYSGSAQQDMLSVAVLLREERPLRIVRVSVPVDPVEETLSSMGTAILFGLVALSVAGLLFALLFSGRLGSRVARMTEFSRKVSRGDFPPEPLPVQGDDELSILERHLNEMSFSLQAKIRGVVDERDKLESVLRCMGEGVLVLDTHGRVILLNDNARRMFQLAPDMELNGASVLEISRHPEMKKLMQEVLACDGAEECFSREVTLEGERSFRVNAASLKSDAEKPLGYILVFHDVTELKRLETVRADFVANVSHELRTPLAAIRGYAETMLQSPPEDPAMARQFLEVIDRHSERLGRLIDDLLTLSDLESGRVRIDRERVNPAEVVRKSLELLQDQAKKRQVTLTREVGDGLPFIPADPDRLQQLLINLIDNAIKYTPRGGRIRVAAQAAQLPGNDGPMVELSVEDTGCGIPERDIPRLTERFYRVDRARSRELGGTGLGLAIVKHIVQAHGGVLRIESEIQKGTRVRVFLPAENGRRV